MPAEAAAALRELVRLRLEFGPAAALRKRALLARLERARLKTARDVLQLHEALCFMRAYPDDRELLTRTERMLARFERRADLRRHRAALADSGIAGTAIHYRFFASTAHWLARHWPGRLTLDWKPFEHEALLEALLPLLASDAESPALDEYDDTPRAWLRRMKGPKESEAAFLIRRLGARLGDRFVYEKLYDYLDLPVTLAPGADTPSRTHAKRARARVVFRRHAFATRRPDLATELLRPPRSVKPVSPREGQRWIDQALAAMVTRSRDLDIFTYGDPRDVRLVDCGDGLEFVCIGGRPERRLMFEAVYGFLTLKNGVPVGYVLTSALFGSSEIAYNVFETYRGAEAAPIYSRVLAMTRHLFGTDTFTVYPYQLGDGNDEGLRSGAWWFYRKLGFEPRDPGARRLMRSELARMRRRPAHRSSRATLARLARHNVYFSHGAARPDVIGELPLARLGLAAMQMMARRFGADRERGETLCAREAMVRLGMESLSGWSMDEKRAWARWAPLVTLLPGLERWSAGERHAAADVIRAKGSRRESDFVWRFDAHQKLREALAKLARSTRE